MQQFSDGLVVRPNLDQKLCHKSKVILSATEEGALSSKTVLILSMKILIPESLNLETMHHVGVNESNVKISTQLVYFRLTWHNIGLGTVVQCVLQYGWNTVQRNTEFQPEKHVFMKVN